MTTLREIMNIVGPEDDDHETWVLTHAMEQKMKRNIRIAFKKCEIDIAGFGDDDDAVYYDHEDRTAIVKLDDSEIPLSKLARLMQSGLANDFTVSTGESVLSIEFTVNAEMDNTI